MANDLRLQVIMDLANKASAPLRNISASSADAAKALKAARDQLKQLNTQQTAVDSFTKQQAAMRASRDQVKLLQQNLQVLRQTQGAHSKAVQAAEKALAKQTGEYHKQKEAALQLRNQLTRLGIGNVSQAQARLKAETTAATAAIAQQDAKLKQLAEQHKKLANLKAQHGKDMMQAGMLAGAGVGMQAAGRGMSRPVLSAVQSYAQQESASSQLAGSMMLANGQVSAEFRQINDLAMRLGDRLPGTTADFIEMMTMLRRQGLSAQSILGGTGEAAAYLGVQLKLPPAAAAEFAAKMQDTTRTTERDMMGLMDLIQRTYYLGVDSDNMLQGFTKLSPALDTLKKQGLDAANSLAPLLVMMDQAGMAGEASGNAIRKIIQAGLDTKKLGKANDVLSDAGAGFQLNFVNDQGQFAGLDNLFAQLQKLKGITSDVQRTSAIKELFGDDAETLQVLGTLMDKGLTGYNDIVGKLQAQADLRKRVNAELGTISNLWEAATGSFTNVMAAMGQTVAPEVKALTTWLGEVAASTRTWIAEHPVLVGWLVKTVALVAGLVFGLGTLAITVASIMGPLLVMRFLLGFLGLKFNLWATAIHVVGTALTWLRGAMLFLAANPVLLAIAAIVIAIAAAAYLIYKHWDTIKQKLSAIWDSMGGTIQGALLTIGRLLINWSPLGLLYQAFAKGLSMLGITLPQHFTSFGSMLMNGLVQGITHGLAAVKNAVVGAATSVASWFKDKLGIRSPSRVFIDAGLNIGQGAAIGIGRSVALVRTASAGLAAATAIGLPAIAAPAVQAPKLPALVAPAIQAPKLPTLAAPAIQAPKLPALVAPAIQAPKLPALAAPAIQAPQLPALAAPAIQAPKLPTLAAPAIQAPKLPTLAAPAIQAPKLPALAAPAVQAYKLPKVAEPASKPIRLDARPPLSTHRATPPVAPSGPINITIHVAPGMDPQAVARAVSAELDRRDRAQTARRRSTLSDIS